MADRAENKPQWRQHGITAEGVEDYLYSLIPARDEVLKQMESEAIERNIPIVGPLVGRVLHQLALMIQAKTIFEMGSAIGYSTIWWARAVAKAGGFFIPMAIGKMPRKLEDTSRGRAF